MPGQRHLILEVADRDDVLLRVVSLCRRRRIELLSLRYVGGDRHRPAQLELSIRDPGGRLVERLAGLVDVRGIEEA